MATNSPSEDGHRQGAIRGRSRVHTPKNNRWVERDTSNGRFKNLKFDQAPFKGVRKEK